MSKMKLVSVHVIVIAESISLQNAFVISVKEVKFESGMISLKIKTIVFFNEIIIFLILTGEKKEKHKESTSKQIYFCSQITK